MTAAAGVRLTLVRASVALTGVAVLAALRVHRPPTLCLLRATTGVPCPFCGTTTAAVRLGRGHPLAALAANPVTVVAAVVIVLAPALRDRVRVPQRAVPWLFTGAAAFAWAWQLARFDKL